MKLLPLAALLLLAVAASAADWENISDATTAQVKPGYGGPTSGVVADRTNGDLFMVISDQGLWRSTDHGATFTRCDGGAIGGRCETGWALQADTAGSRLACFMIYGSSGMSTDRGATWTKFKTTHLDFGAVDWADTAHRLLAIRHESGGMLTTSPDAGTTWTDLGKDYTGCGVLDSHTFLATKTAEPGIFRSTDAGVTWTRVFEQTPAAPVPVLFDKVAYWLAGKTLLVSRDLGATWSALPGVVEASYGPYFADAQHFTVVGPKGFLETSDAGTTWTPAAPLPSGFKIQRVGPNFAWDPRADLFYASAMTRPTFRLTRGK